MRIGIFTIHAAFNCGAMLQAFATQKIIERLGSHQVEIIDYYPLDLEQSNRGRLTKKGIRNLLKYIFSYLLPSSQSKSRNFILFRNKMNLSQRYYSLDKLYEDPPLYDLYVVGSDQMWNMENGFRTVCFLDFVPVGKRKIAYAASFGTNDIPPEYKRQLPSLLNSFSDISCREKDGVRILRESIKEEVTHVLDPTFMLSAEEWLQCIVPCSLKIKGDYILFYSMESVQYRKEYYKLLKNKFGYKTVEICLGLKSNPAVDKSLLNVGPSEFVHLINNASIVCTASFHGLAFALNFEKQFFLFSLSDNYSSRNSRMESLIDTLDLKSQCVSGLDYDFSLQVDYSLVRARLQEEKMRSLKFLKKAIEK